MEGMAAHAKPASQGPRSTRSWPTKAGFWSFRLLAVAALLGVSELPVAASPITYQYIQTSASGSFVMSASITVDENFSDLPTLSSNDFLFMPGTPIDFGNLTAFYFRPSFYSESFATTLDNFVAPYLFIFFPEWRISPTLISYNNTFDSFAVNFATGTVTFRSDNGSTGCFTSQCVATGEWVPVSELPAPIPEPPSVLLFASALAVLALARRAIWAKHLS
jgi:hypothetical protein